VIDAVLSPYDLTDRSPAAMAAFQFAGSLVTLLPTEASDSSSERERFEAACRTIPRYRELMEVWRWSAELWSAGVIGSVWNGEDAATDVARAGQRMAADPALAALALDAESLADPRATLGALTRDLHKGGSDPAVSVPVTAGLDAFAARHALCAIRPEAASHAQKAEARLGRRLFSFIAPAVIQSETERLLDARNRLRVELDELRETVAACIEGRTDQQAVREAARLYAAAFETEREHLTRIEDPDDVRVVTAMMSVTATAAPADAAMRSARALASRLSRPPAPSAQAALALRDEPAGETVSLMLKVISRDTPARPNARS